MSRESSRSKVVVVGAGLSGLTAAYRLLRAGVDVEVLEARNRVGGRAWRTMVGDHTPFDAGGEGIDESHTALLGLAAELGASTRPAAPWAGFGFDGLPVWDIHGERSTGTPPLDADELAIYRELGATISRLAARIDPEHPGDLDGAGELDELSLADWLANHGATRRVLTAAETYYSIPSTGVPLGQLSLLAFAAKVAAGASPNGLNLRFIDGPSALADAMWSELGTRVCLEARCVAVAQDAGAVRVRLADGAEHEYGRAVIAAPLTLQREIRFEPDLPRHRLRALAEANYGDVVKVAFEFDKAFWEKDHAPMVLADHGLLFASDPANPALTYFIGGGPAVELAALTPARRKAVLLERLSATLVNAPAPTAVAVAVWSAERFSRGAYLIFAPGQLLRWGQRLSEAVGRVHFAGGEASTIPSYLEGAVQAGERAAREVLAAL